MLTDLSSVELAKGDIEASERLDRAALEIRKATLGPRHPTIAEVMENLAGSLSMLGDFEEAERLGREALARRFFCSPMTSISGQKSAATMGTWPSVFRA